MSIKDKIENAREDDWLTKDLSEEELNKIKAAIKKEKIMTIEEALSYLKWARPIKPYSFDKKRVQKAIDMAIKALELLDKLDKTITEQIDISYDQVECQTLRWVLDKMSEMEE